MDATHTPFRYDSTNHERMYLALVADKDIDHRLVGFECNRLPDTGDVLMWPTANGNTVLNVYWRIDEVRQVQEDLHERYGAQWRWSSYALCVCRRLSPSETREIEKIYPWRKIPQEA
jgi:hypothetical protein